MDEFNAATSGTEETAFFCEHCERPTGLKLVAVVAVHGHPVLSRQLVCVECGWVRVLG